MKVFHKFAKKVNLLCRSESGVAAVEFSIILPLLLFLFLGTLELSVAASHNLRVSKAGFSLADLVARSEDVSRDMDDINLAMAHQMDPFDIGSLDVRVGMIEIKGEVAKVIWSWGNVEQQPWPKRSVFDAFELSADMLKDGETYVISTANFDYSPILGSLVANLGRIFYGSSKDFLTINLHDNFVLQPRQVKCVEYKKSC